MKVIDLGNTPLKSETGFVGIINHYMVSRCLLMFSGIVNSKAIF